MTSGPAATGDVVAAVVASGSLVVALGLALRLAVTATRSATLVRRLPGRPGAAGVALGPPRAGTPFGHGAGTPFGHGAGPRWLAPALVAADVDLDASTVWALWRAGAPLLSAAAFVLAGPGLAVAALAAGVVGPPLVLRARRGRGDAQVDAGLPAALEAVARGLRSGASLRQAVAEAAARTPGSLGHELERVSTQAERGVPLVQALDDLARRRPLPGVRLAVAALGLGAETGGAQARAVDGVATTLRDRQAVLGEVRALSSQARISALVMSLAPLGFGAFAAATDPRIAAFLFHTGAGFALLAAGATLDALGWLWMNRLSRVSP